MTNKNETDFCPKCGLEMYKKGLPNHIASHYRKEPMTNKQSWGVRETVDKIFEAMGQYGGCDVLILAKAEEIIKELLTSKAEQMEEEKKNTVTFEMLDNEEAEVRNYEMAFNAGISKAIEILKQ